MYRMHKFIQNKKKILIAAGAVMFIAIIGIVWFLISKKNLNNSNSYPSTEDSVTSPEPQPLADVYPEDQHFTAIQYLWREGVLTGDEKNNFHPQQIVSRGEWAELLVALTGSNPDLKKDRLCFSDVAGKPFEPAVCYVWRQGWMASEDGWMAQEKQSFFRLIGIAYAKEASLFGEQHPVKTTEAIGSLARAMNWGVTSPERAMGDDAQALMFAKQVNIYQPQGADDAITRGEAAGIVFRALATLPFGQDTYDPKYDEAVKGYSVPELVVGSDHSRDNGLARAVTATELVAGCKKKIANLEQAGEHKKASETGFYCLKYGLERFSESPDLPSLGANRYHETTNYINYCKVSIAQKETDMSATAPMTHFVLLQHLMGFSFDCLKALNSDLHDPSLVPRFGSDDLRETTNLVDHCQAIMSALKGQYDPVHCEPGDVSRRDDVIKNLKKVESWCTKSWNSDAHDPSIAGPRFDDDDYGTNELYSHRVCGIQPDAPTDAPLVKSQSTTWGSADNWETAYEVYFWLHIQDPRLYPTFWDAYNDPNIINQVLRTLPLGEPVDLHAYFNTPGVREYYESMRTAANNDLMPPIANFLKDINQYQANLHAPKSEPKPEAPQPTNEITPNPEVEKFDRWLKECYNRPLSKTKAEQEERDQRDSIPGSPCYNPDIKPCQKAPDGTCLPDSISTESR